MICGIITLLSPAIVTDKYFVISDLYLKVISDNRKVFFDSPEEVKYWMNLIAATKKTNIF